MFKLIFSLLLLISFNSTANNLVRDINAKGPIKSQTMAIPYVFYNGSTGASVAAVVLNKGLIQPQATILVNSFASDNGSYSAFLALNDLQVKSFERLFFDSSFMVSKWGELYSYQDGNPQYTNEISGNIDSSRDNYILASGDDNYYRLSFKYVLPWGDAKTEAIHEFRTDRGLLVKGYEAGGGDWNPLSSGRTFLSLKPFYREQDLADDDNDTFYNISSGVKFELSYDNSDWFMNATKGSITTLSVARDWGQEEKSSTWTAIQFEYSKFISFGSTQSARQRTLAFNLWTSDVPTWDSFSIKNGTKIYHRAPLFEGSTLGGIDRQRGLLSNRFHDRSAINYSVEYRYTPVGNPFKSIPLVKNLPIPFWQIVTFAEVGSVAEKWTISDLHRKMIVSIGAGLRISVAGLIIRLDAAASEDGGEMQMFFNQAF